MNYLKTIYNEKDKPYTDYPLHLAGYLYKRCNLSAGQKLLDIGCGRGEYIDNFNIYGLDAIGIDRDLLSDNPRIIEADFNEKFPFGDETFDVCFAKSVIEHTFHPEKIFQEAYRVLKPNGKLIVLVPDWESVYKVFYEDYTHKMPFTIYSVKQIFEEHNFKVEICEKFRQLPFTWNFPELKIICKLTSLFYRYETKSKLIKYSKELMLLGMGVKL